MPSITQFEPYTNTSIVNQHHSSAIDNAKIDRLFQLISEYKDNFAMLEDIMSFNRKT